MLAGTDTQKIEWIPPLTITKAYYLSVVPVINIYGQLFHPPRSGRPINKTYSHSQLQDDLASSIEIFLSLKLHCLSNEDSFIT